MTCSFNVIAVRCLVWLVCMKVSLKKKLTSYVCKADINRPETHLRKQLMWTGEVKPDLNECCQTRLCNNSLIKNRIILAGSRKNPETVMFAKTYVTLYWLNEMAKLLHMPQLFKKFIRYKVLQFDLQNKKCTKYLALLIIFSLQKSTKSGIC